MVSDSCDHYFSDAWLVGCVMSDRELLEMAAKAEGREAPYDHHGVFSAWVGSVESGHWWNPLEDDGDAFRLANALGLWIERGTEPSVSAAKSSWIGQMTEPYAHHDGDKNSAARLAVVRAAAEIGRALP